ncbi:MAG: hypothetical protein J5879_05860 [Clostridia bacterium]|nr:hypothetical protein [Clostridia bacterium]
MKAWQKFLLLIGVFAVSEALYQVFLHIEHHFSPGTQYCTLVLGVIVSGLLLAIVILNRGFDGSEVAADSLDISLTYEERTKKAAQINRNKKTAKILMLVFIPLAVVYSLDLLDLFFDISDKLALLFAVGVVKGFA